MRFFIGFVCLFLSLQLTAQVPGGGRPGGGNGQMNIGRFYGKIVDTKTNKPIDAASVQLYQNRMDTATKTRKEVLVNGQLTKANGDFSLEGLSPMGNYKLLVTAIGFKTIEQTISFGLKPGGGQEDMMAMLDKDLGNIKLETDVQQLSEVVVTADKPTLQLGIDRKIFNVEKNIVSQGGTGVDVMRNVPTVNVDIDGNITMRNSAPQIFVDGRPTVLTLDQIPADAIQSIELITNPSAKYDASGGQSAIINIVLKKNRRVGYSGSVRAGIDMRARLNGGGDINIRQGKLNFFANIGLNQRRGISFGETDRNNFGDPTPNTAFTDNRNISDGFFRFGRAGIDFLIDNRNTLTLQGNFGGGNFDITDQNLIRYDTAYSTPKTIFEDRNTDGKSIFRNNGATISYKYNFPRAGRELTADINYNKSRSENNQDIIYTKWLDENRTQLANARQIQGVNAGGNNAFIVGQLDYTDPINENIKVEAGLRSQTRLFESFQRNFINGVSQPLISNEFSYVDYVHAAYASFSQKIKKANLNYQVGLRVESSSYDGEQAGKTERFQNQFPLALFPSIFLSKSFAEKQDMQINYSRRINRPNFFQLLPNTDYSDIFNYQTGNPNLKPEFTNSLELTYQKTYGDKNNTVLATLFGKQTNNLISRYVVRDKLGDSQDSANINTWINANRSYAAGVELVFRNTVAKWWEINYNVNVYYSKIDGSDISPDLKNERTSYTIKLNNSFRLGNGWTMQLSGDYNSRSILPVSSGGGGRGGGGRGGGGGWMMGGGNIATTQGYIDDNYYVDFGVRKEFKIKKNTASLALNWSDVFSTRRNNVFAQSQVLEQYSWRRRDPTFVRLNFNYRFGKFDASLFKRKNTRSEGGGEDMQMQ
ncbi:TonB-dependent receptor domain-containing protein [Lacibacter sp.]|uniref:TonB-dependent receptor domain-containing protein n=1 Tax=Lacibacter sp. TaxID=1915409 RepID=UPI002B4ADE2E|nr:TonB-dependent receptor [Lacibacter sp.]HLP35448.1 TonB-dependent receptor [Lacibacter sp.]